MNTKPVPRNCGCKRQRLRRSRRHQHQPRCRSRRRLRRATSRRQKYGTVIPPLWPTAALPPPRRAATRRWRVQVAIGGWSLLLPLGCALGATLSSESSVGIAADYNSNPALLATGASAAESVAVVATLPATYSSDSESFDLVPQLRLAETHGDAQLLTDYQYLDADWHLASERNSFSASAGWHRDSTFYNVYENTALHGRTLPRLEDSASLAWQRELSESSNLQLQAAWNQVDFSARSSFRLDNESYEQASIQYFRALSEHWSSTSSIGWGL